LFIGFIIHKYYTNPDSGNTMLTTWRTITMNDHSVYTINTGALFYALNSHRKGKDLAEIDNALIASKLGILFALKTNGYINFKSDLIQLNDAQLIALREILEQHFDANITEQIRTLVITAETVTTDNNSEIEHSISSASNSEKKSGLLGKIKGLFRTKSRVRERHV
jgi:hypothetical protein